MTVAFPLTPLQEGMFLEARDSLNPGIYLQQLVFHLDDEPIDHAAMEAAWSDAFIMHPALRLTINAGEVLSQSVNPSVPVKIDFLDWTGKTASTITADYEAFLAKDRAKGTAGDRHPSSRFTLIQTGPSEGKLIWSFPHSLLDGRSVAPILTETFTRYQGHLDRTSFKKPAPVEKNLAFAEHCRALHALDQQPGIAHFADTLNGWEGGSGLLNLEAESAPRAFATQMLTQRETRKLEQLAQQASVPMSTLIMTSWGIVTARLSGRGDTVFGNTLAGRHLLKGMQDAVGCFIVTVPLRLQLTRGLTLGQALNDMRAQQISLRPFEQTPLTQIRAQTDVPPGVPLFDTVVAYETTTIDAQMRNLGNGWEKRRVDVLEEGSTPATLAVYHGEQMKLSIEYDPQQVPKGPRVALYLKHFLSNLIEASPDTQLATISMLDADEIRSLRHLSGENATQEVSPTHCLSLFEKQVALRPNHIAVSQLGSQSFEYEALNSAANKLAHLLIEKGVEPHDIVGICTSRSPLFAVAILAVWKAGAAFVPMDPSYPKETLNIIEKDSTAHLILTDDSAPQFDTQTLNLARQPASDFPESEPDVLCAPDDPAYVIFTSGSTGRPKGVTVSQSSLAAHSEATRKLYELSPDDRALQFASLSFDVALEEIVSTLLAGATLIMRTPEMSQSTTVFLEECGVAKISLLNLPTGFWVALTDALETSNASLPDTVRMVIVGGERVPLSVLRRWHAILPDVPWVNGYGPTETTITCTAHRLNPDDLERASVPIGTPLGHAAAWVLAADGSLAPEGTEGELWISGPAVTMGYLGRADMTAERFTVPGFDASVGRSYATGDRAVWQGKLLSYVGRMDRQLKLRGFRIEPGQIEQVIEAHADIARAHVDLLTMPGAQPRLLAWYSSADPAQLVDAETLTARLTTALPAHMRPELIHVDHWPQTPGGKIDTPKLPNPLQAVITCEVEADDSPLTLEVAKLFAQILRIEHVPSHSSFFELGGDSLLLLRLLSLLEQEFDIRIKPVAVYAEPTPAGVAKVLHKNETDPLVMIPIQPEGSAAPLYAVHVLGDNGSFFRPLAQELGNEQPVYGLTVGLLTDDTPTTVEDIARFYLHQIERHNPHGPLSLVAVSAGSYVTFELAQQLTAAGRTVQALIFLDSSGPGGRSRARGWTKLGVHARLFARHPRAYVRSTYLSKREDVQHSMARKKLAKDVGEHDAVQSIAAFVAANALSIEQYRPKPYKGRITIIRAGHDLFDTEDARKDGLGWKAVAGGEMDVFDVPGEHLSMLRPPYVPGLARRIALVMKQSERPKE